MEICKNKDSGQYFIYINEAGRDEAVFVTPEAKIKILSLDLFGEIEKNHEDTLLALGLITQPQIRRFREYERNRSDDVVEQLKYLLEQMTPYEKRQLIDELQKDLSKTKE